MNNQTFLLVTGRVLEEGDREAFKKELGTFPITDYRIVTVERNLGVNSYALVCMYLVCQNKMLELYLDTWHKTSKYARMCAIYYGLSESFYRVKEPYKKIGIRNLILIERSLYDRAFNSTVDELDDEDYDTIVSLLKMPNPVMHYVDMESEVDKLIKGVMITDGKGGFIIKDIPEV